jgi:hypothetical protein
MAVARAFLGVIAFAGVLAAPTAVNAAAPKGALQEDLRRAASDYADCVVRSYAPIVRGVILQNFGNTQISEDSLARRLITGTCIEGPQSDVAIGRQAPPGIRFGGDLFRYSLADALVRNDYPEIRNFDFNTVPPLSHRDPSPIEPSLASGTSRKAKMAQQAHATAVGAALFSRFGECVCRRDPGNAHKLILSRIMTDGENAAFSALAPALGQCLSSGQMRLSREVVRGLVALNFYRLAGPPAGAEVTKLKGVTDA